MKTKYPIFCLQEPNNRKLGLATPVLGFTGDIL